jgi:dTDP-4-dehydrorhamnose reductase
MNKIINLLGKGKVIKAPINSEGNFSFIPDVSRATKELIKRNKKGTYHVAGAGIYSLYNSALKAAEIFGFNKELIIPVNKEFFNDKVKRPSSPLDISKLEKEGIKMRDLDEGFLEIKEIL